MRYRSYLPLTYDAPDLTIKPSQNVTSDDNQSLDAAFRSIIGAFLNLKKSVEGHDVTISGQKMPADKALFIVELMLLGADGNIVRQAVAKVCSGNSKSSLEIIASLLCEIGHSLGAEKHARALETIHAIEKLLGGNN